MHPPEINRYHSFSEPTTETFCQGMACCKAGPLRRLPPTTTDLVASPFIRNTFASRPPPKKLVPQSSRFSSHLAARTESIMLVPIGVLKHSVSDNPRPTKIQRPRRPTSAYILGKTVRE